MKGGSYFWCRSFSEENAINRGVKMSKYLFPLPLVLVAGCASISNYSSSYVSPNITQDDIKLIANDFVRNLKKPLPPATTTLIVKKIKQKTTLLLSLLISCDGMDIT